MPSPSWKCGRRSSDVLAAAIANGTSFLLARTASPTRFFPGDRNRARTSHIHQRTCVFPRSTLGMPRHARTHTQTRTKTMQGGHCRCCRGPDRPSQWSVLGDRCCWSVPTALHRWSMLGVPQAASDESRFGFTDGISPVASAPARPECRKRKRWRRMRRMVCDKVSSFRYVPLHRLPAIFGHPHDSHAERSVVRSTIRPVQLPIL
jgi:hypothetical protein